MSPVITYDVWSSNRETQVSRVTKMFLRHCVSEKGCVHDQGLGCGGGGSAGGGWFALALASRSMEHVLAQSQKV